MQEAGFTPEEFGKLQEAEDNSNALVTTETIAMHAVKGELDDGRGGSTRKASPDAELGRRIMHDRKYHDDKATIMGPIGEFERILDHRTEETMLHHRRRVDLLQLAGLALTAAALVTLWLGIRSHAGTPRVARMGTAIGQIEHVTHQSAAAAEQGSVAAEEMNAQAAPLRGVVGDLESMVAARTAVAAAPTAPMDTE